MLSRVARFRFNLTSPPEIDGLIRVVVRYPAHCHPQAQALLDELPGWARGWMVQSGQPLQLAALTGALHGHLQARLGGRDATVRPLSVTCRLGRLEFIEETAS